MIDFSFDFNLWETWRNVIYWSVRCLGIVTALWALGSYKVSSRRDTSALSIFIFIVLLFMLGLFPIEWGYGTDRANYAYEFIRQFDMNGRDVVADPGFFVISNFLNLFLNVKQYFVALTLVYLSNYFIAINKLVREKSFWLAVAVVISFGFTSYIINTMRSGLALSFVILGLSFYPSKKKMLLCFFMAVFMHKSSIIPVTMIAISYLYDRTRLFYKLWILAVPISFVASGFFMSHFAMLSDDSRTSYLSNLAETSYNVGFRIDFILYSLIPILVGGFYIFKKNFKDRLYLLIYNSYILTNIFWVLVIRANYTDRFAYLSWFMIPFVMMYPLLKQKMTLKENVWLGLILMGQTVFGFLI